jgi:hypothetical protein
MKSIFVLAAMTAAACGGGKGGGAAAKTADPAAANAAIPADWKAKLEFVGERDAKRGVSYVTPKGWVEGVIPGVRKPPEGAGLGFMTSYGVGTNCDGMCEAKEWGPIVDQVEFADLAKAGTVERDDQIAGRRAMLAKVGERTIYAVAWWKTGAKHYVTCRATLDGPFAAAAPAFVAACDATQPNL